MSHVTHMNNQHDHSHMQDELQHIRTSNTPSSTLNNFVFVFNSHMKDQLKHICTSNTPSSTLNVFFFLNSHMKDELEHIEYPLFKSVLQLIFHMAAKKQNCHVTHMNESRHTYERVMSHI